MTEGSPLLSTPGSARAMQRQTLLAIAALAAVSMACVALVSPSTSRTVLSGDGVVPVDQLSFTKALAAHAKGVRKLDDVAARSAMNSYFDTMGEQYSSEHKAALKRAITGQSLNQWFDKKAAQYHAETEEEKAARKSRHPGKLFVHRKQLGQLKMLDAAAKDTASVNSAEDPDDVPADKKESVEDKMIRAVADFEEKAKEKQAAKFARDNAAQKKQIDAVKAYEAAQKAKAAAKAAKEEKKEADVRAAVAKQKAELSHFKAMREASEEAAETDESKELKDYKAQLAKKTESAAEAEEAVEHTQAKKLADYKAKLAKKTEASEEAEEAAEQKQAKAVEDYKAKLAAKETPEGHLRHHLAMKKETAPFVSKKLAKGEKVKVGFYMESMCPGCKYYTKNVLGKLMDKPEFRSMVDFKLYPYGNGRLTGSSISCQHGADECYGNTILACMQAYYPVSEESAGFVPAFVCMEAKSGKPVDDFKECAAKHSIHEETILKCADGDMGKKYALAAAQATEALNPPHEYAPWVTMNGEPMRDASYELQDHVCDSYAEPNEKLCSAKSLASVDGALLHDSEARSVCHNDY